MPRPPSLSPELLQTFLTIVRTDGDAMSASRTLGINQPSMSKRLAILQHAGRVLQRPWIERRGKKWFLTQEGRRVLPAVEEILHRYGILTGAISESDRPALSFANGREYSSGIVRDAIQTWRKEHPDAKFRLATPRAELRIEGVANGSYDLALVTESEDEIYHLAHRPLQIDPLFDDPLVMVAAPNCPEFAEFEVLPERKASPKSVTQFPLLLLESEISVRQHLDDRFREGELRDRLQIILELSDAKSLLDYVRDGLGVGILPRSTFVGEEMKGLVVKALPAALSPVNVVKLISRIRPVTEELDLSPAAMNFREILITAAKNWLS